MAMQVYLNGEPRQLDTPMTIAELLAQLGLGGQRIAVEVGLCVVPKSQHGQYRLQDGDRIEIIQAMGGG